MSSWALAAFSWCVCPSAGDERCSPSSVLSRMSGRREMLPFTRSQQDERCPSSTGGRRAVLAQLADGTVLAALRRWWWWFSCSVVSDSLRPHGL